MATILDLLAALNRGDLPPLPDPAKPVPIPYAPTNLGPLSTDTTAAFGALNPEPVPPAITPPTLPDSNFIDQYAGLRPTAPAPLSRGQRIANALAGFGAGFQGNGAQFLQQLQEPQRRYERQRAEYEDRRTRGLEIAERRAEREQEMAMRRAEAQYNREYNQWLKKVDIRRDEANEQARQAFELVKESRRTAEADRKEKALFRRQLDLQIDDRIKAYRDQGAGKYAEELAQNDFRRALTDLGEKVAPLSKAAEKANVLVQAKIQRALRLAAGGGGSATGKNIVEIVDGQGRVLGQMPYSQVKFDNNTGEPRGFPGATIRFPQKQAAPQGPTLQLPEYDPTRIFQQLAPPAPGPSDEDVKAYAKRFKMSRDKARKELMGQ